MKWYHTIFNKNPEYKQFKNDKRKLPKNIYENKMTYSEHVRKFHKIHYWFKYKFLVPLLLLAEKLFRKTLIKKIPKAHHNRNIQIFDKAYEEAIKKWCIYYRRNTGPPHLRKSKHFWIRKHVKDNGYDSSVKSLRVMKEMINTMYLYDTAYREFINILLHEISHGMVEFYARNPEKFLESNKTGHMFFSTDIYDVNYFILEKAVSYNVHLSIEEVNKLLNDYYLYHPKARQTNLQALW